MLKIMQLTRVRLSLLASLVLACNVAWAAAPVEFLDATEEARFNVLIEELRCLVCQNQNIKDSDAPLAEDLRRQILEQIRAGQDDAAIKQFLVDRYGDFVLYRPPLNANTVLLWLGPVLILLLGGLTIWRSVRRRTALSAEQDESAS